MPPAIEELKAKILKDKTMIQTLKQYLPTKEEI